MFVPCRAKAKPNKKAKLNKPADDDTTANPEKTPEPSEPNTDAVLDDPPAQDHDTFVEQVEIDPMAHDDNPPSPTKAADDKTDDVIVSGLAIQPPATPLLYQNIAPKRNFML